MEKHITIVGYLYIIFGVLGLGAGIIVALIIAGSGLLSGDLAAMGITAVIGIFVGLLLLVLSLPGIIGGYGVLKRRNWARILLIILGVLNLVNIPIGTILGAYTLWALTSSDSKYIFR